MLLPSRTRSAWGSLCLFIRFGNAALSFCLFEGDGGKNIFGLDIVDGLNHQGPLVQLALLCVELLVELCLGLLYLFYSLEEFRRVDPVNAAGLRDAGCRGHSWSLRYHVIISKELTAEERDEFECTVHFCLR